MYNSKQNYRVVIRLSEEENKQLEFLSDELGISRAEAIRELITGSSYKLYYGYNRSKKQEENKMEDYKLRMVKEYKELKEKYTKLHTMLVKYDAGKLNFTPTCPIDLLRKQASVMGQYLYILETRAVIENVDLNIEI